MRRPRYPLEPLAEIRRSKVETAAVRLEAAKREHDVARRAAQTSEQHRRDHEASAERIRSDEGVALDGGDLRVADLDRKNAWEVRVAGERATLESEVERARKAESSAHAHEDRARGDVVGRATEERVIVQDRARWTELQRKRSEACEEEASSEAWRPK